MELKASASASHLDPAVLIWLFQRFREVRVELVESAMANPSDNSMRVVHKLELRSKVVRVVSLRENLPR